jgi:GNAT superfamily N-acetyltransferase
MEGMRIDTIHNRFVEEILGIARSLPEWFTPTGIENIKRDLEFEKVLMAFEPVQNIAIGFLSFHCYDGVGIVGWMGVKDEYRRQSIGTKLFEAFKEQMKVRNIDQVQVETLGESVDYEPYEQTRRFYRKMGFQTYRVETLDNPECPERLTMRMSI